LRTIIIGGTFNPIHNGHMYVSEELRVQLGYERVLFIPSNSQAYKSNSDLVPLKNRIAMLDLALKDSTSIIDLCEIERGGISYMIDTVQMVQEKYKISGRIGLFIGDDLISGLKDWQNVEDLLEVVDIVVAHRESELELDTKLTHKYLDNVSIHISSSDIRNRIKKSMAFRYLIPENVYEYILEKDLYK
jgi:nicotinate-nucleotide adenylyltransferase